MIILSWGGGGGSLCCRARLHCQIHNQPKLEIPCLSIFAFSLNFSWSACAVHVHGQVQPSHPHPYSAVRLSSQIVVLLRSTRINCSYGYPVSGNFISQPTFLAILFGKLTFKYHSSYRSWRSRICGQTIDC